MNLNGALAELGFDHSPSYVQSADLRFGYARSHAFRQAIDTCFLKGVYFLGKTQTRTPLVFVAEAKDSATAGLIHQRVWNQNIVPLLVVSTPDDVRLYHTFQTPLGAENRDVVAVARTIDEVSTKLAMAHASSLDSGEVWTRANIKATRRGRVDAALLERLDKLVRRLHHAGVDPSTAYTLIGKLLFLKYLRDRRILSDRKLSDFGVDESLTLSNRLEIPKLERLISETERWLGGQVFPINLSTVPERELRVAAGTFSGHDPLDEQLSLGFSLFDFSFIPVETLSSVYQRLLHSTSAGRSLGAYYTPTPLIEFLLDEAEEAAPLSVESTVFDPSCGSGAFLVHAFRRIVEKHLEQRGEISPVELRHRLTHQIFGVDRDSGACRVAQLSLLLTMLDYVKPPDLVKLPTFKLPALFGQNIVQRDFFDASDWQSRPIGYDWVVGNPPWLEVNGESDEAGQRHALEWMRANDANKPVASNQLAEAFVWRSLELVKAKGVVALVVPAITLFKDNPRFLRELVRQTTVTSIANFSSFATVLFENAGTAAATFVIKPRAPKRDHETLVFTPLVINQPTALSTAGHRIRPLSIILNRSEIRSVPSRDIETASPARWKALAIAGPRHAALLGRLGDEHPTLQQWLTSAKLTALEGPQLRKRSSGEQTKFFQELVGKNELLTEPLRGTGRLHRFPDDALRPVEANRAYLRTRGGFSPLEICRPPHVIVSASLKFAVFSQEFVVVPPRQIGIAGADERALRLLSVFLSSSVVRYHQYFASPQGGIRGGRTTIASVRGLPCPIGRLKTDEQDRWLSIHEERVKSGAGPLVDPEIDRAVSAAFRLSEYERAMVEDFVSQLMPLSYGDVADEAVRVPQPGEVRAYASTLKELIDLHFDGHRRRANIRVTLGGAYGVVEITFAPRGGVVIDANVALPQIAGYTSHSEPQWAYLDRNLLVVELDRRFFFKPLQAIWWSRSQASADADRVVGEAVTSWGANGFEGGITHRTNSH